MSKERKSWEELADDLSECIKILDVTDERIWRLHLQIHEMLGQFKRKQKEFDKAQESKDPFKYWLREDDED